MCRVAEVARDAQLGAARETPFRDAIGRRMLAELTLPTDIALLRDDCVQFVFAFIPT